MTVDFIVQDDGVEEEGVEEEVEDLRGLSGVPVGGITLRRRAVPV